MPAEDQTLVSKIIAEKLLEINAVRLSPSKPFRWSSGWQSPIYCDNRITLSYTEVRELIRQELVQLIRHSFVDVEAISGVATGAIAHGALVADSLGVPFSYVRPSAKGHGLENQVEGVVAKGQRLVVVEDLVSTGLSSLRAVETLRNTGAEVLGMVAIFSYGFDLTMARYREQGVLLRTLSNYNDLLQVSVDKGLIDENQLSLLVEWRACPEKWGQPISHD